MNKNGYYVRREVLQRRISAFIVCTSPCHCLHAVFVKLMHVKHTPLEWHLTISGTLTGLLACEMACCDIHVRKKQASKTQLGGLLLMHVKFKGAHESIVRRDTGLR